MCLPVIIKRNEMLEEYIGQLSAAINRPAILYENQGDQSFEGDQKMGLRRGLKWGGPSVQHCRHMYMGKQEQSY